MRYIVSFFTIEEVLSFSSSSIACSLFLLSVAIRFISLFVKRKEIATSSNRLSKKFT